MPLQGALLIAIVPRAPPWAKSFCPFRACCFWSFWVFSPYLNHLRNLTSESTLKVVFGSFPYKMPFDYQMVTFEEIIKNDFFKWAQ